MSRYTDGVMTTGTSRGRRWTYEDYLGFPDDGNRYELIGGKVYVTPSPTTVHQRILMRLSYRIADFLEERRLGELFPAPCDVLLSKHDVVEPDLLYVAAERSEIVTDPNVKGPPDLVIEILSPTTRRRDLTAKLDLYERYRVREYWIVDPDAGEIQVRRLAGERYGLPEVHSAEGGEGIESPLLPGLKVDPAEIFG